MRQFFLCIIFKLCFSLIVFADEVKIVSGENTLYSNELFTISIYMPLGNKGGEVGSFPEIYGFSKRRTYYHREGNIQRVVQYYSPSKAGNYFLPPFKILVNGKIINGEGVEIEVLKGKNIHFELPWEDEITFFVKWDKLKGEPEGKKGDSLFYYEDPFVDAHLDFYVNKNEVYAGENFELVVSFCISRDNRVEMNFTNILEQVLAIRKKVKITDLWLDNTPAKDHLEMDSVEFNGKIYNRYILFRENVSSLREGKLIFPAVDWQILKYLIRKTPLYTDRKDEMVLYRSKPLVVLVKALPEHPLKDHVAVGKFSLKEKLYPARVEPGQKSRYELVVEGGHMWGYNFQPFMYARSGLEFYNIGMDAGKGGHSGELSKDFHKFMFDIVSERNGAYNLGEYINWIYFDPVTHKYDTLKPVSVLHVLGESEGHLYADFEREEFYNQIRFYEKYGIGNDNEKIFKIFANIFLLTLLLATLVLILKK